MTPLEKLAEQIIRLPKAELLTLAASLPPSVKQYLREGMSSNYIGNKK